MGPHIEIGCGPAGPRTAPPGHTVAIGLDLDVSTLRTGRRAGATWPALCGHGLALPLADSSCGSAALHAVLHHLTPVTAALAELSRVLEPGGRVTISDGVALKAERSRRLRQELHDAGLPDEPAHGFQPVRLKELLARNSLVVRRFSIDGTAVFATPPFVGEIYSSDRFVLEAVRSTRSEP